MKITRPTTATAKLPADRFSGDACLDAIADPDPGRVQAGLVHFTPGARTSWHTHPLGQTIFVTEGVGRCQREGGPIETIRPGDSVYFEPGENHWHGAAPDRFMVHVAMLATDDAGNSTDWGALVTDEEYGAA
jgi:quercetin dioxygenase-like cupin family protein